MGRDNAVEEPDDYDFEQDVQIDPDNLDACWVEQSSLFGKYSKLQAVAEALQALSIQILGIHQERELLCVRESLHPPSGMHHPQQSRRVK